MSTVTTPPTTPSTRKQQSQPAIVDRAAQLLTRYSIPILRVSLGVVFLVFGVLKFFPDMSPAEDLAVNTVESLSFGIVSGSTALFVTALTETFIAVTLITGRFLRPGLVVLGGAIMGMLSTLVLSFDQMIVDGAPTLEAQYVFKDFVLIAAALVITAKALGARFEY